MNKKKFNKLINKKIKIDNNFGEINKKIDYSQYKEIKETSNKFIKLFLNKRVMAITCSVILLGIALPLLNPFKTTSTQNSSLKNNETTNIVSSNVNSNSVVNSQEQSFSSMVNSEPNTSSNSEIEQPYVVIEPVYGIIKNDDNEVKKFYTSAEYNLEISDFKYTGYYNLGNVIAKNYKLEEGIISYEEGSEILGIDLPLGTKCYCGIVVEVKGTSQYQVGNVYDIRKIIL